MPYHNTAIEFPDCPNADPDSVVRLLSTVQGTDHHYQFVKTREHTQTRLSLGDSDVVVIKERNRIPKSHRRGEFPATETLLHMVRTFDEADEPVRRVLFTLANNELDRIRVCCRMSEDGRLHESITREGHLFQCPKDYHPDDCARIELTMSMLCETTYLNRRDSTNFKDLFAAGAVANPAWHSSEVQEAGFLLMATMLKAPILLMKYEQSTELPKDFIRSRIDWANLFWTTYPI